MPTRDSQPLLEGLRDQLPAHLADTPIEIWPNIRDLDKVRMVIVWQQPSGLLGELPNLAVVHSYGAGVEHVLDDPALPENAVVARVSGPLLAASMSDYLLKQVIAYAEQQKAESVDSLHIGFLGFGQLAQAAAAMFSERGHQVSAWRRIVIDSEIATVYGGLSGLTDMLQQLDVLICLLPLTPSTQAILDLSLFQKTKHGLFLINVGRGAHLVEADLFPALDRGYLSGACLDVTCVEPLPKGDPLAVHPQIKLTHHTASLTDPQEAAGVIAVNYERLMTNTELLFVANREAGY